MIYWICATVGGAFVLLSILGGHDDVAFEADSNLDFEGHGDLDLDWHDPGESKATKAPRRDVLRPVLFLAQGVRSLKFWTFGGCFFGLTGLLLNGVSPTLGATLIGAIALGMGLLIGTLAAGALRLLRRRQVNSLVQSEDLVGALATVELPFDQQSRGKVRIQIKGSMLELGAYTNDPKPLNLGETVMVIGVEQNRVWVVSQDTLNHPLPESWPNSDAPP